MSGIWRCGRFGLSLDAPLVMGILNVTPDSFSDGGAHDDTPSAIAHAESMLAQGAGIIDVGGESTRPGSDEVTPAEEERRVLPVVRELAARGVVVSVDTRHVGVAESCVEAGASIINDVSGFRDPVMVSLAARCDAGLVVMHMAGEPRNMQQSPHYDDVVAEVADYLERRCVELESAGVARDRIVIDPGIGFGKTLQHNLALLRAGAHLSAVGRPVLIGASRKRMIGEMTGEELPSNRLGGSVAVALCSARRGAAVVRVHDVAATVQALSVQSAIDAG